MLQYRRSLPGPVNRHMIYLCIHVRTSALPTHYAYLSVYLSD